MAPVDFHDRKKALRQLARARRDNQSDKDAVSECILARVLALPAYATARTVLCYLDVRSEVRTRPVLASVLASGKRLVVPWCNAPNELELFHLESLAELVVGRYGILEPLSDLRTVPHKIVRPEDLDLVLVPGVAFDRRGARLGHGAGYYDKLLHQVHRDAPLIGLAFACQLFDEVPTEPHDAFVDLVVTESEVIEPHRKRRG